VNETPRSDRPTVAPDDAGAGVTERIRRAFDRSERALSLRPALGMHTAVSRITVREGLVCEIEEGRWKLTADLSDKAGGTGAGPDPGVFGRAAFGSCLAMGYVLWALKRGVPVDGVQVEVHADFDAGAQYGVSDAPAGYKEVRYAVKLESSAPEEDVMRVLDEAEAHSPYFDVFGRGQKLHRTVDISKPEE